jgi:outer membrane receptor protein involved in Fe transport
LKITNYGNHDPDLYNYLFPRILSSQLALVRMKIILNKTILRKTILAAISLFICTNSDILAQNQKTGSVSGIVIESVNLMPLEFATVAVRKSKDSTLVQGAVTYKNGKFKIENIPQGEYKITYSFIGFDTRTTLPFKIEEGHLNVDLGQVKISTSTSSLNEVIVSGERSTYVNSIDRKTFNVGKDLISKTGSVSDLMQNIPSLTVDIDGVVSLRGSSSVMILINGKPSALMGANRAAVLQQMPANTVEKIEVITNPSAKYKPDGTSGIINIVLKKNKFLGFNGTVTANAGNSQRYNGNVIANYNPGKINISGSYSIRQDDRERYTDDSRTKTDTATGEQTYSTLNVNDHSRPLSHIISTGLDYRINDNNSAGITGSYNIRNFDRSQNYLNNSFDSKYNLIKDYDRINDGSQFERDLEFGATAVHKFNEEDHELSLDLVASSSYEEEDNHYSNIYRIPENPSTYDNTLIKQDDKESQLTLEYINPLSETSKLEAGYVFEYQYSNMDFYGEAKNFETGLWETDNQKTNQFIYSTNIHVLYGTYEKEFGRFGFLGGIRAEDAFTNGNQVTTDTIIKSQYFRLYPSLHLSYKLTDIHELQLNYSHRIRRPEGDELNPFPEYQDPYNLRTGNPYLEPEDIHSIEMGYQYKRKNITFLSTVYYRYLYNGITSITKYINDTVLLTTSENLSKNRSAGLELVLTSTLSDRVNLNLSTNTFYNTIDASSLGYSENKSAISTSANLSAAINITKSTVIQITSNFAGKKITPQGEMAPSFVMNTGFKQEFLGNKAAVIVTVSDIFNSLRNNSTINTPELYQTVIRKRSARIFYAGLTYNFGKQSEKKKNSQLNYDNKL